MAKGRKFITKLRNTYRLTLINDKTFAETFSIKLTPINVLMLFSSLLLIFSVLVFLLIAYTPMRSLVPGSVGRGGTKETTELIQEIEDLKQDIENNKIKHESLIRILTEDTTLKDTNAIKSITQPK